MPSTPDAIVIRTVPPVEGWPPWTLTDPSAQIPDELRITADSLQFLEPAPGYRFRYDGPDVIVHEPV